MLTPYIHQMRCRINCKKLEFFQNLIAFLQVPIAPDEHHKTAFFPGPGMGLYEFCCFPFGLSESPGTFQRLMDRVHRGFDFAMVYIDDTEKAHMEHLNQVFQRIHDHGLCLHGEKCKIGFTQFHI
uniref:Reverse transcriptase domain-containing protein n=1 Tax=Amphimedon queenslandica TaxID=400682 RepID=A0A1X7UWN6_AMPQE